MIISSLVGANLRGGGPVLSHTAEYALRAVLYVAQHATEAPVRVGQVASALKLPQNYLSKILHAIVNHFDRIEGRRTCLLGRAACSDRHACAVHWRWKSLSDEVVRFFRDTTVATLLSGTRVPA